MWPRVRGWKASLSSCRAAASREPRAAVADVHAPLAAQAVEVAVAVDVGHPGAVALGDDERALGAGGRAPAHLVPDGAVPFGSTLCCASPTAPFRGGGTLSMDGPSNRRRATWVARNHMTQHTKSNRRRSARPPRRKGEGRGGNRLGNEDLAREGRLQEAQSDAEREAEREARGGAPGGGGGRTARRRAEPSLSASGCTGSRPQEEREAAIEHDRERAEAAAERDAARERAAAGGVRAAASRRPWKPSARPPCPRRARRGARPRPRADAIDPEQGR